MINDFIWHYAKTNEHRKYKLKRKFKMIKEVCKILRDRLQFRGDLPFLEVYAGLVQTVTYKTEDENGVSLTKKMPVSYDTNLSAGCGVSPEKALTPDSSVKGIIYFEENGGAQPVRAISGGGQMYKLSLTCVVWLNRERITGDAYSEISAKAFHEVLKKLKATEISAPFINLNVTEGRFRQNESIFSKYSYDETILQFLRPPFEYFAIDLIVTFIMRGDCLPEININPKTC